jgi:hypothetical protein
LKSFLDKSKYKGACFQVSVGRVEMPEFTIHHLFALMDPATFNQAFVLKQRSQTGVTTKQEIDEENNDTFFKEKTLVTNIQKVFLKTLTDKAMTMLMKHRRILEKRHALKKLLRRIKSKKYADVLARYEAELARIQAQAAMRLELAKYNAAHKDALKRMEACLKQHDALIAKRAAIAMLKQVLLEYHGQKLADIFKRSSNRNVAALSFNVNVLAAIIQQNALFHIRRQNIIQAKQAIMNEYHLLTTINHFEKTSGYLNDSRMITLEKEEQELINSQIAGLREIGEHFECDAIKNASKETLEAIIKETNEANHQSGFYTKLAELEIEEKQIDMEMELNHKRINDLYEEIKENHANSDNSTIQAEDNIKQLEKSLEQRMQDFSSFADNKPSRKRM